MDAQITGMYMQDLYPKLVEHVEMWGSKVSPRGQACLEVRPMSFTLTEPERALYFGKARRLNYRFFATETLGYIAGLDDVWYTDLLCHTNQNFERFRDEDKRLAGAYGPVIRNSLREAAELLQRDPDTRQALVCLWSPGIKDKIHNNTMCTCLLHFFRNPTFMNSNLLDLQVYMRSNDLDWGTPYDVPAFCSIQAMLAGCLGWGIGSYHHTAGSLHLYEDHKPNVSNPEDVTLSLPHNLNPPQFSEKQRSELGADGLVAACQSKAYDFLKIAYYYIRDGKRLNALNVPTFHEEEKAYFHLDHCEVTEFGGMWLRPYLNMLKFSWKSETRI